MGKHGHGRGRPGLAVHLGGRDDSPEELYALYDGAVRRYRERFATVLADGWPRWAGCRCSCGRVANLCRLVCDLLEEYGPHTGHAELLREAVDGRSGEDPDPGWVPPF